MKKHLSTFLLILVFLAGLSLLLYPTVSDYWNSLHQSFAYSTYAERVAKMDDVDYYEYLQQARQYNARLARDSRLNLNPKGEALEEYYNTLQIDDTGIMGSIMIEKLDVFLPIYHGTDDAVLQIAVGHLPGTSLPVGGPNTHMMLSGHRGLPSAKLFSDLDRMEIGDVFVVYTLDEVLTYMVDRIDVVLPYELDALRIEPGRDLCTLVTCTPYGINSHRLLVRGTRIETEVRTDIRVTADAQRVEPVQYMPFLIGPFLLWVLFVILTLPAAYRKKTLR